VLGSVIRTFLRSMPLVVESQ